MWSKNLGPKECQEGVEIARMSLTTSEVQKELFLTLQREGRLLQTILTPTEVVNELTRHRLEAVLAYSLSSNYTKNTTVQHWTSCDPLLG